MRKRHLLLVRLRLQRAVNRAFNKLKGIPRYYLALGTVALVAICGMLFYLMLPVTAPSKPVSTVSSNNLNARLREINELLTHVETTLADNKSLSHQERDELVNKMAAISQQLPTLANQDSVTAIANTMDTNTQALKAKLDTLQRAVNDVQTLVAPTHYLSPDVLGFKLVSVDIWNGIPYVAISLEGHNKLLGLHDKALGWELSALDYAAQSAIFVDTQGRQVRVAG